MEYQTRTHQPIREIGTVWIPMQDGCRLAARIWLPVDAETDPVPAILDYVPYRRRDTIALSDASRQPYIAGHGYAAVRVDIRGVGDSGGVMQDEYTDLEHDDICSIIAWLAEQAWCSGSVGMWGISWGGFNSLQTAARNPPALKAIITLCASDDRYADDAHYLGGCLIEANLRWGTRFVSETARPPDPLIVGESWRDTWIDRLENLRLFPETWMQHQTRDAYWKRGSVCEAFADIKIPVFAVGGWSDAYVDSVGTTLAGLTSPRLGLIGPWGHDYPHEARPGPAIGFLQEALRWWDYWLKGNDTGIMDEPMLRAWVLAAERPAVTRPERPGRWVSVDDWPPKNPDQQVLYLNADGLGAQASAEKLLSHQSPQTTGIEGGEWNVWGSGAEFAGDQRPDDDRSLCFDSAPLDRDLELLGGPTLGLTFSVDQPVALAAVRLCDVWPDGASHRISFGVRNLTHLQDHEFAHLLEPGRIYTVDISLRNIAYSVAEGHRLRLAISTSYWPLLWPSPRPVTISVKTGASRLTLPLGPRNPDTRPVPTFESPVGSRLVEHKTVVAPNSSRDITREPDTGVTKYVVRRDPGINWLADTDIVCGSHGEAIFEIGDGDPLTAKHRELVTQVLERGDWRIRVEVETVLTTSEGEFLLSGKLDAYEGDECVWTKNWRHQIARNHL
jgi:putative CocE/NonD family hydrolase